MRIFVGPGLAGALIWFSGPALAYIGPGSGISLLGGLWAILVAIVLAVGAVLIWPIRYLFRRLRRRRRDVGAIASVQSGTADEPPRNEPPTSSSD